MIDSEVGSHGYDERLFLGTLAAGLAHELNNPAAAARLVDSLSAVEAEIYQVKNQSGQDPLNFPIKINNRLANLLRVVNSGDGKPIANAPVLLEKYSELLKVETDRLAAVIAADLVAFNAELSRLGMETVAP